MGTAHSKHCELRELVDVWGMCVPFCVFLGVQLGAVSLFHLVFLKNKLNFSEIDLCF